MIKRRAVLYRALREEEGTPQCGCATYPHKIEVHAHLVILFE